MTGFAVIGLEGVAVVGGIEQGLPLDALVLLGHDRDDGALAEAGGVVVVHHGAARFDVAQAVLVLLDGHALVLPVHQVGAGEVVPLGAVLPRDTPAL